MENKNPVQFILEKFTLIATTFPFHTPQISKYSVKLGQVSNVDSQNE